MDEHGEQETTRQRSPLRRAGKLLLTLTLIALAFAGLAAGAVVVLSDRLAGQVERFPGVFSELDPEQRPPQTPMMTFLLVGTDSRAGQPTTGAAAPGTEFTPGSQRSDVVMLAQVSADGSHAGVVSLPRDSWVDVPGHGTTKLNAAYSLGGPGLLVHTVESLTKIRVDHFAVIDFSGFRALTDAVGGINVNVASPATTEGFRFHAGPNHLDGPAALAYVRQRKNLPGGDLTRVQRQQSALRALLESAVSGGMLSDPLRTYRFLDTLTHWVSVDDTLTNSALRSLALDLRSLRPGNITFLTAPVSGLGQEDGQSVVYLDSRRAPRLWRALAAGNLEHYVRQFPDSRLGSSTR
ncbi:LCP family protein required for cell wall assembly [Saccharomonospora amisosensis]|uniref:LCP family protein required for cell wall assembly n=1 Tax=Saccharomonospora amisosensis TaxID=1128677 RepID=A0A7X5US14_9PSEU|nr:LCP family protein [Saccharomonospora amisosensis]NIJ13142.1 LCP family protein required for cell wall assembly [Saccharomonospora amisosensis]